MNSPWGAFALSQLTGRTPERRSQRFQPNPAGLFQTGGAAQAVDEFLKSQPGRFFTMVQLIAATGRTDKSLDWACRFLVSIGRLEWHADESRNPRYRRYRHKPIQSDDGERE